MRDRCQQMRGDLGLLVMGHRHVERDRRRRHAAPLGRPAGPGRVEVAEVDRPLDHQVAAPAGRELALTRADTHAPREADVTHGAPVVRPDARLLEPVQVEVLDETGEADRLARSPRLVGVGAEHEVGPGGGARRAEPRRVLLGGEPADLELHAGEALLAELRDLPGDVLRAVVAADRDHGQAVAISTPESVERLAERLADRVPDRGVDAGRGDEAEPAVAQDVERGRACELPAALDAERVLADQPRRDLRPQDLVDLVEAGVLVTAVGLADDALLGTDPRHDRRAVRHLVRAAAVGLRERHADRDRLDLGDREARDRAARTDLHIDVEFGHGIPRLGMVTVPARTVGERRRDCQRRRLASETVPAIVSWLPAAPLPRRRGRPRG